MTTCALVVPGGPMGRTGGTLYGQHLLAGLRQLGHRVQVVTLDDRWPWPREPDRHVHRLGRLEQGLPLLVDGLLWTGLAPALGPVLPRHPCTVIVHSPLFRETGLTTVQRARLFDAEAEALQLAQHIVGTGGPTVRDLRAQFGLKAHCIEPGIHPRPPAPASDPTALACLATVTPRKDHPFLLKVLSETVLRNHRLACAGSLARSPTHAIRCQALAETLSVADRTTWHGELGPGPLAHLLDHTGTLVQTAHYEAYGMAIAEAVAAGIPVVSRPAGALEGACGEAAVIVDTDDPAVFAEAIHDLDHTGLRRIARRIAPTLPGWKAVAGRFSSEVLGGRLV